MLEEYFHMHVVKTYVTECNAHAFTKENFFSK